MSVILIIGLFLGSSIASPVDETHSRVVGGTDAVLGQFPFFAGIWKKSFKCSASIVSDRFIVTAAHCLAKNTPEILSVYMGEINKKKPTGPRYFAKKLYVHEGYNESKQHDIGLIELKTPIDFTNPNVKPIELEEDIIDEVRPVTLIGWGRFGNEIAGTGILQYANVTAITLEECRKTFKGVNDLEVCAQDKSGKGFCYGDSGGPLVANNKIIGVASRGYVCGKGRPELYIRIASHREWILNHIKNAN